MKFLKSMEGICMLVGAFIGGYLGSKMGIAAMGDAISGFIPLTILGALLGFIYGKLRKLKKIIANLEKRVRELESET